MNHQLYETWILDEHPVTDSEKMELETHLKDCASCTRLAESWGKVNKSLKSAPQAAAPAYFMRNWKANLEIRKYEIEKRRKRNLGLILGIAGAVLIFVLIAVAVPGISLISISVALLTSFVNLLTNLAEIWGLIARSIARIPTGTLIGISVVLCSWFVFASIAWGVSIYKLLTRREQLA
jgi:hypothetical protein